MARETDGRERNVFGYLTHEFETYDQRPLGDVDSLVLACLSYFQLPAEAEAARTEEGMDLRDLFRAEWLEGMTGGLWGPAGLSRLLACVAASPRMRGIRLSCYVEDLDAAREKQFSACTLRLPGGDAYVSFRGTDNTLVGWKEDFNMAFERDVPSQVSARAYLERVAPTISGRIYVGGHSKGGNLAVWAAVHAPALLRRRILMVYSNDGPGFHRDLTHTPAYRGLAPRIVTYVPQASLVGALLHQDPRARTVKSHGHGTAGQHDPFTWEVHSGSFRFLPRRSRQAQREADGFRGWVDSMAPAERAEFTDVLFSLLSAAQAETLSELSEHWADTALAALGAYRALPPETRRDMLKYIWRFLRNLSTGGKAHPHRLH